MSASTGIGTSVSVITATPPARQISANHINAIDCICKPTDGGQSPGTDSLFGRLCTLTGPR